MLTQKKKEEGNKMENVDSTVYLRTRLHQSKMMAIKRRRKNRPVFVCAVAQSPGCCDVVHETGLCVRLFRYLSV